MWSLESCFGEDVCVVDAWCGVGQVHEVCGVEFDVSSFGVFEEVDVDSADSCDFS